MFDVVKYNVDKPYIYITRTLRSLGYKPVDSGSFATVWAHKESGVVFKIGKVKVNKPYLAWLKTLEKAQPTKYEPVIHTLGYFGKYFVVSMEKLESYYNAYFDGDKFLDRIEGITVYGRRAPKDKELRAAVERLREAHREPGACWDWHEYNIMLRGKQPVIIDPLWNPRDKWD